MITTTSLELMGRPSADRATCGMLVTMPAASRSMMLMISLAAALRTTVTLSSEPVDFNVCCTPLAIIRTAVKTNTTRAMPRIVKTVVRRRDDELRKMYFSGICIYLPTCLKPSTIRVVRIRRIGMIEAMKPTSKPATHANRTVSGLM